MKSIASDLGALIQAHKNCLENGNKKWSAAHAERILAIVNEHAPSGSGFDAGTTIDIEASTSEKLVFRTSFHHMNENGFYDGWTDHSVIVTPSLAYDFDLRITGRNRDGIKDCIYEAFSYFLGQELPST